MYFVMFRYFEKLIQSTLKSVLLMNLCENATVGDEEKWLKH